MNLKRLVNTSDLNWWLVLAGIGCNLILMVIVTWVGAGPLRQGGAMVTASQLVSPLGSFLATFFTAVISGWMGQGNGTTYGLIASAGAAGNHWVPLGECRAPNAPPYQWGLGAA